jgi:signal transduction histidine kinase
LRKFDEASIHFEKSLKKAIENGDRRNQIESLIGLAKVSFEKEDFQKSKESLDKALLAAGKTSYKNLLISIYQQYAVLADNDKDFEKASNFRKLYIQLRDSVSSESMIKNLATIQTNYVEKENLATIEANKLVIEQQKTIGVAVIIIGALLLLIALVFYHQKAQIRKVNKNLNDRIDEATKEIFESHEKLKKAVFERDYFMYKTSHDIKGPLATFLGLCMIAKLDVKDAPALEHVERIEKTALKLNAILNRLLNIEKINLNEVAYTFVDFRTMVENIVNLEKRTMPSERISISYEIEPNLIVKSDSFLIRLIVENLISNSIKFYDNSTNAFPYVKIAIFGREDKVVIKVDDNGIGILPEMEPTIFKLFARASERSETGGVGLYTAKQAAEKLEGTIGFKCIRGLTTFEAVLPMDMGPILRKQRELENKLEERRKKTNKPQTKDLSLVF